MQSKIPLAIDAEHNSCCHHMCVCTRLHHAAVCLVCLSLPFSKPGCTTFAAGLGPHNEQLVRFDKRDAAAALLQLGVTEQEVAGVGLTLAQLWAFKNCSHAYLYGRVSAPDAGYTSAELAQLQVQQRAAGQQWGTDAQAGEDAAAEPGAG